MVSLLDEFGGVAERYRRVYRDAFGRGVPEGVVPSDGELDAAAVSWPLLLEPQVRAFFQAFVFEAPLGWLHLVSFDGIGRSMEGYEESLDYAAVELESVGDSWGEVYGLKPGPVVLPIADGDAQLHLVERYDGGIRVLSYAAGYSDYPRASVCARDVLSFVSAIVAVVETGRLEAIDFTHLPYGAFIPGDDEMLLAFTDILDAHGANEDLSFTGWAHMHGRAKFPDGNQPRPS